MTFRTLKIDQEMYKLPTLHRLSKINTESKQKFTELNPAKLTVELELIITKPV